MLFSHPGQLQSLLYIKIINVFIYFISCYSNFGDTLHKRSWHNVTRDMTKNDPFKDFFFYKSKCTQNTPLCFWCFVPSVSPARCSFVMTWSVPSGCGMTRSGMTWGGIPHSSALPRSGSRSFTSLAMSWGFIPAWWCRGSLRKRSFKNQYNLTLLS